MNIIKNNPYRVLGLPANSTERELQKQIATIKRFAEVGKTKSFDYDFNFLGEISRTDKDVQRASSQLEQSKNKLHYSMFWFVNKSHIDEIAINHLINKDADKAEEIWTGTIKNDITIKNYTSLANLSTLLLDLYKTNGDIEKLRKGIELKGKLIFSDIFSDYEALILGDNIGIDNQEVGVAFAEATIELFSDDNQLSDAVLISMFSAFPKPIQKRIASKFIDGPIYDIEILVDETTKRRRNSPDTANKAGSSLYTGTKNDLTFLKSILGADNLQYQSLTKKVADELIQCSIDYFNEWRDDSNNDPGEEALQLVKLADKIAVDIQTKDRIYENTEILSEWVEEAPTRRKQDAVAKELDYITNAIKEIQNVRPSIQNARNFLTNCKPKLHSIGSSLGSNNELYLAASSAVAHNAMGMLVEVLNSQQENLDRGSILISDFSSIVNSTISIFHDIGSLDLNYEIREHYDENYAVLLSIKGKVQRAEANSGNSGGCYIATMAYGDYDHPQVVKLRQFRDKTLSKYKTGRTFIKLYYATSPRLVRILKNKAHVNHLIRLSLDQFIKLLKR